MAVGGYFLLFIIDDLNNQRDNRCNDQTEGEKLLPCNHVHAPPFFRLGARSTSPPDNPGGTAYRGAGSTKDGITYHVEDCNSFRQESSGEPIYEFPAALSVSENSTYSFDYMHST